MEGAGGWEVVRVDGGGGRWREVDVQVILVAAAVAGREGGKRPNLDNIDIIFHICPLLSSV